MKIALFLGRNASVDSGGTYSFERQLLIALAQFIESDTHQFHVFGWDKEIPPEILDATHIHFVGNLEKKQFQGIVSILKSIYLKIFKYQKFKYKITLIKIFIQNLFWDSSSKISKEIRDRKIDMAWFLGLDCPILEVPFITTVWDLQHRIQPYYPEVSIDGQWLLRENFYSVMLRRAAFVVTGTRTGRDEIEQLFNIPSKKIKIIPFPTPQFALNASPCHETKREGVLRKYNLNQDYLFYPAQLWPHKNHVGLLLALKFLKENHEILMTAVFSGSDKGNYRYLKSKVEEFDLSDQITFTGFVSCEDLTLLYQNALALTFVTYAGPDNLPPLEAFALGCPVIASRVSGAQEQLGDAALLVDPRNYKEIALAIKSLKEDPHLRQTLISRGVVRASKWTGEDYIREVCLILDEFSPIRACWSNEQPYDIRANFFDSN